jgi:hypothetical protein
MKEDKPLLLFHPSSFIPHPFPRREVSMPADVILHNAKIATNRVPSFVEAVATRHVEGY